MRSAWARWLAVALPWGLVLGACNFLKTVTPSFDGSTESKKKDEEAATFGATTSTASKPAKKASTTPATSSSGNPLGLLAAVSAAASASPTASPLPAAPAAPADLVAGITTATSVKVSWTDVSANETGFEIERCSGLNCTTFAFVTNVAAASTSYTNTGLTNGSTYRVRVRAYNAGGKSPWLTSGNLVVFAGATTTSGIGGDRVTVEWANVGSAASYAVYNVTSGTAQFVASVNAPATSYTVTGLTPNTQYSFRVKMTTTDGNTDTNAADVQATTATVTVNFGGWWNVKAFGATSPDAWTGITPGARQVVLKWKASTVSSGAITSYNIYRATTSAGQDFNSPLATGISADTANCAVYANAACSHTDNTAALAAGTAYFYVVRAVVGGSVIASTEADKEIKVMVPPDNMVLIHRWIANREICEAMGQSATIDRANNYRCDYNNGIGATANKYDFGLNLLMDRYEVGCGYTQPAICDATIGCIGKTGAPAGGVGSAGNTYFSREGGGAPACYHKIDGATWLDADSGALTSGQRALMLTNKPGLPPVVNISQNRAWDSCAALAVTVGGASRTKRLPSHHEQVVASAWAPDVGESLAATIEAGTATLTDGYCNTNSAAAYTKGAGSANDFNDDARPANFNTLPSTNTQAVYLLRTGSAYSPNCVSRYGAQDLVGNANEWASDQLASCNTGAHTCTGGTSGLDASNTNWNTFDFNGAEGPGAGGANITNWAYSATSFTATRLIIPMGLPVVTGAGLGSLAINTDFNVSILHNDGIWIDTDSTVNARGAVGGGAYNTGGLAGRFMLDLRNQPTAATAQIGFRCAVSAD